MTMTARGLAKLVEELGELAQVIGKRLAYYSTDEHPDGGPPLSERLTDELADVLASCRLVATLNDVDTAKLEARVQRKMVQFAQWESETGNNQHGVDAAYERGLRDAYRAASASDVREGWSAALEAIRALLDGAEPPAYGDAIRAAERLADETALQDPTLQGLLRAVHEWMHNDNPGAPEIIEAGGEWLERGCPGLKQP